MINEFERKDVSPLRYWVHAILPLVYDDSLSYYEVLAKISQKMNEVIEGLNANYEQVDDVTKYTQQQFTNLTLAFNNFQQSMLDRQGTFETKVLDSQQSFETQLQGDIANWEATTEEKFNQQYEANKQDLDNKYNEFLNSYLQTLGIVEEQGQDTTKVMSQKYVTNNALLYRDAGILNNKTLLVDDLPIGTYYFNKISENVSGLPEDIGDNNELGLLVLSQNRYILYNSRNDYMWTGAAGGAWYRIVNDNIGYTVHDRSELPADLDLLKGDTQIKQGSYYIVPSESNNVPSFLVGKECILLVDILSQIYQTP